MTTTNAPVDGRTARAGRTHDAVIEAFLTLTEDGHLRPTARQISERAGVSLRSVFQHFEDLEAVFAAAADLQIERHKHLAVEISADAPFEERLALFLKSRCAILDAVTPVRRSAVAQAPFSEEIARRLRWSRKVNSDEVQRLFAQELAQFPATKRRLVAVALHSATDWFTWETFRTQSGLSFNDAVKAMSLTVRCLLKKETA